jgi:hypothetical protein
MEKEPPQEQQEVKKDENKKEGKKKRDGKKNKMLLSLYLKPWLNGEYNDYIKEEERKKFLSLLDGIEIWLGDQDIEEMQKSTVINKYNDLKKLGNVVIIRYEEEKNYEQFIPLMLKNMEKVLKEMENSNY